MDRVVRSLGRIMSDNHNSRASGADRESSGVNAGMGERPAPQPFDVRPRGFGVESHSHEEVSIAERPRQRQIGCETCGLSFEPHHRRIKCHMCSLWMHEECIETLDIGTKWHAEMCLSCQQRSTGN